MKIWRDNCIHLEVTCTHWGNKGGGVAFDRVVADCTCSCSLHVHRPSQPPDSQLAGAAVSSGRNCRVTWAQELAWDRNRTESRGNGTRFVAFWCSGLDG